METPTITKKQQQKTLSGKKAARKSLRSVLTQPYDTYWPLIDDDKAAELTTVLHSVLPAAQLPPSSISWSELRKIPREQRKAKKQELQPGVLPETKKLRQCLLLGVNAVTKAVEKGTASCVLLAAGVDPPVLTHHVAQLCSIHKVPLLVVPQLKDVVRTSLGFSSMALGFAMCVSTSEGNHFHALYKKVCELSSAFPWIEPSVLFHEKVEDRVHNDVRSVASPDSPKPIVDLYKYRTSRKERAFVPGQRSDVKSEADFLLLRSSNAIVSDEEFLSDADRSEASIPALGISSCWFKPEGNTSDGCKGVYKEPVVKRMQPNPNKVRKKKMKMQ